MRAAAFGVPVEGGYPSVDLAFPSAAGAPLPEIHAVMVGLLEHGEKLYALGHAHVRLDANARHYIAHVALAYLQAAGFKVVPPMTAEARAHLREQIKFAIEQGVSS